MYQITEKAAQEVATFSDGTEQKINLSVSPSGGNVKYRYIGNGPDFGIAVDKESAFQYALERTGIKVVDDHAPDYQEFADMFEEWFFQLWNKVDEYEADT